MKLVTYRTPVNYRVFWLQHWILIQKLPSIILSLVCYLRLPGMNLPCPMLRIRLERRNLVRIVMSSHRHLNETLFNVLFTAISLSLHMVLMHSRASSRTAVIISCIEAVAGTMFPSAFFFVIREIISLIYSLSIIEIFFLMVAADRGRDSNLPSARTYARRHVPPPCVHQYCLIIRLNEALRLLDVLLTTQFILHVIDEKLLLKVNHLRAVHLIRHTDL